MKKGSGRTPDQQRVWMREYMRARRAGTLVRKRAANRGPDAPERIPEPRIPIYDPYRDGPMLHASLTAMLMGDPPVGRRAVVR